MKKISFLFTIIAILLLVVGCGKSSAQKPQIKVDLPQNFTYIEISKMHERGDKEKIIYEGDTTYIKNKTPKEIYKQVYENFCLKKLSYGCEVQQIGNDILMLGFKFKLLDKNGRDILPYIEYPYKDIDENRIWKKLVGYTKKSDARYFNGCRPEELAQPRFNESTEFDFSEVKQLQNL